MLAIVYIISGTLPRGGTYTTSVSHADQINPIVGFKELSNVQVDEWVTMAAEDQRLQFPNDAIIGWHHRGCRPWR